jgi:hypothetical protein
MVRTERDTGRARSALGVTQYDHEVASYILYCDVS